jgi:CubicO group peptidase (beta-lactamase class C family)
MGNRAVICSVVGACTLLGFSGAAGAEEPEKSAGAVPVYSETGPDAAAYGAAQGFPLASKATTSQMQHLVAAYSHFDEIFPARAVAHAAVAWSFRRAATELKVSYAFQSNVYSLADYLSRNPTTGLLIAKDDTILFEHYQYARSDGDRFLSQSMAKTIVAMLIGIAVSEGAIKSIDDVVATYVPELAGSEYGKTALRDLLHMASGVAFSEIYDGKDDLSRLAADLLGPSGKRAIASVTQFNTRVEPPGSKWHYASVETEILGLVLRAAVQRPVADYLSEKIWQPIGTEADASWTIDNNGMEVAFCCFNAVLRDYARLGRLLAHDGSWEGRQLIPRQWIVDATTVRSGDTYLAPGTATPVYGYGYQVWLLPGSERRFVLLGIRGQMIFIDPAAKLVMAHTAVRQKPVDPGNAETRALWSAVAHELGK